jgi:hypothetical protein
VAAAAPVIAVLALVPTGRQSHRLVVLPPNSAVPGATKRPAGPAPRVVFQESGWHVWYADEDTTGFGELDFARDGAKIRNGAPVGGGVGLTWFPVSDVRGYIQDRAQEASIKTTERVVGSTAHVVQYKDGGRPGHESYSAIWIYGRRGFELRAVAANISAFKALLSHVHAVSGAAWTRALPPSVVKVPQRDSVIRAMLRGIPLPPGFKETQIPGSSLDRDRYQLGAAVTGTVACEWFARWGSARRTGDSAEVNQAITAMQTAKHWPVLMQMDKSGAWGSVLLGYVKAMPSGRWFGRPLLGDVNSGLGCSQLHVKLGALPQTQPGTPVSK